MNKLFSAFCAAIVLSSVAVSAATADPARVIVRGANPYITPDYAPTYSGDGGYWSNYGGFYGDPLSQYYDPAGVVPDWRYHGPKAIDVSLARTLDRNGESMLGHMLTCQARHATYNPVSNTFYGRHGVPVRCED